MSSPPPIFPQQHQASVHQSEDDAMIMDTSGEDGASSGPSTSSLQLPSHTPGPSTFSVQPPSQPSATFEGHTYTHLPGHLAAMMSSLPALPVPQHHRGRPPIASMHGPSPVSFFFILLFFFLV
jgi:hypothetical protein